MYHSLLMSYTTTAVSGFREPYLTWILSPFSFAERKDAIGAKIIKKNIGRHENGNLYFVSRRKGKLNRQSLGTKDLKEAKRKIRELGTITLTSPRDPMPPPLPAPPVPMLTAAVEEKPTAPTVPPMSLAEALVAHDRGVIVLSKGTQEMLDRGNRAISRFATGWDDFDPVGIWKQCRATGVERKPPSVRCLNALDLLSGDGEYGRFQAACGCPDLIAGWAARFAAAQLAGSRASRLHGRVTGRRSITSRR